MRPMLATTGTTVPAGTEWVHEVKWDGMRVLADVREGRLRLTSRVENDVTVSFPELAPLGGLFEDMLLDGEVVAMEDGRPSFHALADRMHVKDARRARALVGVRPVTFMVFDVLRLLGQDLTTHPWSARRELLERLDLEDQHWRVPQVYDDGEQLLAATREQQLEGVVSKRRSSAYLPGRRSADWVKLPHRGTWSAVVGGWRPEKTNDSGRLGAVLLGLPDGSGGWRFAGRMGSGIAGRAATALAEALAPHTRTSSPFVDDVPRLDSTGATWTDPVVVVEARALELSSLHRLRQPAYLGIRTDLTAADLQEAGAGA